MCSGAGAAHAAVTSDVLHMLRSRRGAHSRYTRRAPCAPEQERRTRPLRPMCSMCCGAGEAHTSVTSDVLHMLRLRSGASDRYARDVLHVLRPRRGAHTRDAPDVAHVLRPRRGAPGDRRGPCGKEHIGHEASEALGPLKRCAHVARSASLTWKRRRKTRYTDRKPRAPHSNRHEASVARERSDVLPRDP